MADKIVFTPAEVAAMQRWPEALRALADWHDYQETMAAEMDNEVFAPQIKYHGERRKELRAEADRITREADKAEQRALGVGVDLTKPHWRCICGTVAMPLTDDTVCKCLDTYHQQWTRVVPADMGGLAK